MEGRVIRERMKEKGKGDEEGRGGRTGRKREEKGRSRRRKEKERRKRRKRRERRKGEGEGGDKKREIKKRNEFTKVTAVYIKILMSVTLRYSISTLEQAKYNHHNIRKENMATQSI